MTSRPPARPPSLEGYEFEKLLGSGGFADVFLYRQQRPQRRVAIKVLSASVLDESVRRQFDAEANVMATMSTHPSIVTIHQADVTPEHTACIVMEYCPRPNYGARFRRERISVAEALRVGVQIAGAVETAHRAGILHRDIKPANILVTEYNRPALTDFGISVAAGGSFEPDDSQGLSIPWSAPEAFADPPRAEVRSDVFALAATVYSLIAGRTPFERPAGSNSASDLIARISSEPLAPLSRPDVPEALNRALSVAMAKAPEGRYESALAFGRALQQVEMAMSLPITQMDVLDEHGPAHPAEHTGENDIEAHTNIRRVSTVDPDAPSRPVLDPYAGVADSVTDRRRVDDRGRPRSEEDTATRLRPAAAPSTSRPPAPIGSVAAEQRSVGGAHATGSAASAEPGRRRGPVWPFVVLACVLVVGLGVGTMAFVRSTFVVPEEPTTTAATTQDTWEVQAEDLPTNVQTTVLEKEHGTSPATVQISWDTPHGMSSNDDIAAEWVDLPEEYGDAETQTRARGGSSVTLPVPLQWDEPCFTLTVVSKDGDVGPATKKTCMDVEELRSS
ncbi:serine/threonine protein kinase [Brachybacterium endophyticum]|uniref:non-specific serine/threonine protein kinase n=1 Tax=Brachybacterium endophyticum TaxID=2182385 RepID=A0A2U2RGY7_9MICO|nr:serine/threonine-protein kinase [Brachybacterium endophyticum]PWH05035.1 serine/threonine protein kinase [Brachybacterium endophyticum]